jgi:hypothetical protein
VDDVVQIARHDPVVDDVAVEIGEIEISRGLGDQEDHEDKNLAKVRTKIRAQQSR